MHIARAVLFGVTASFLSGCATGVKGSPRRICYEAGIKPGTPEFSNCWRNVARSQGTVPFDDPAAIEIYKGMLGAVSSVATPAPPVAPSREDRIGTGGRTPPQVSPGLQYRATRKEQDLYEISNGRLIGTQFCYVYAYSARVTLESDKIIFLDEGKTCKIQKVYR